MKRQKQPKPPEPHPQVEIRSSVVREIRQHSRSSMSAEICGVLIGSAAGGTTFVEAAIQGDEARQGGTHVTFTQETWSHIYKIKDSEYPDKRIVGWYHSHPGFGIFLSEHDTFIHSNFFSDPCQIAWVYDPHTDEEGCFAWSGGAIERLTRLRIDDAVHDSDPPAAVARIAAEPAVPLDAAPSAPVRRRGDWVRFALLFLSHCFVLLLGFGAGYVLSARIIVIPEGDLSKSPRAIEGGQQGRPDGGQNR